MAAPMEVTHKLLHGSSTSAGTVFWGRFSCHYPVNIKVLPKNSRPCNPPYSLPSKHQLSQTREGFLRKNIVVVSFFQNCAIPIFLIHLQIFSIKRNHLSMNIFSIYIHTCPVNIHCHFNYTDRFRPGI